LLFYFQVAKKKMPAPEDENELITTVQLKFTDGTNVQTFQWRDLDGDGGVGSNDSEHLRLKPIKHINWMLRFLDESKMPAVDITEEVGEESDEHLLVFTPSPAALMTYTYDDKDVNNFPYWSYWKLENDQHRVQVHCRLCCVISHLSMV
jgi:hypothetical protein